MLSLLDNCPSNIMAPKNKKCKGCKNRQRRRGSDFCDRATTPCELLYKDKLAAKRLNVKRLQNNA